MLKPGSGQRAGIRAALVLLACFLVGDAAPVVLALVQDGEARQPLAGAIVTSEGSDIMAVTDSSGQCVVVAVPKRGGMLVASRAGYLDARVAWPSPSKPVPDTIKTDLILYPNRPRVVAGRVFDAGTKLTVPGARIAVAGSELAESAGDDGGFVFSRFPSGSQTLEASAPGYPVTSLAVQVKGGESTSVDLYLLDTANVGSVEGIVFDAGTGKPVVDARVTVEGTGGMASTDSTGRYVIVSVPVGMNKLLVSRDGYLKAYTVVRLAKNWTVTANLYLRETAPMRVPRR